MLRHSRGLLGLRAGLQRILACCGLALLFSASPSFAQSTTGQNKSTQATSVAQQVQLEGELEVLHWDNRDKTSITKHFLRTADGKRYELKFHGRAPHHLFSGAKLRVKGTLSGNVITLNTGSTTSTGSLVVTQSIAPNTFGPQNTLVMLVNFQDQPTNQPWTAAQVNSFVFGTVSSYFQENSYNQTSLTGNVVGWSTIPVNSTTCDQTGIATYAKQAATAAGFNLAAYTRYVYIFPNTSACAWSGTATVGGNPSQAWINGQLQVSVVGHELGHNFGLYHSHSWNCTDGSIIGTSTSCSGVEYGDGVDVMGWAPNGHLSAFNKEHLGWLNSGILPPITTVQTSGTYTIDPYETPGTNPKALKILKGINPSTGKNVYYYIEYRQAIGLDSVLSSSSSMMNAANILNGVLIHTGSPDDSANTGYLLDMTPATTTDLYTRDPALAVGQTFTDTAAGVTITTRWVNSTNAAVDVTFANNTSSATCVHAAPSVVLSTSQTTSVAAGTAVSYTVAVTNNDNSACAASSFNLQSILPSGWSGSLGSSTLTISPGSAASTTLLVTSATTALAGTYSVGTTATNSASTSYTGSSSTTYSVAATTTTTTKTKGKRL